MAGEKRVDRERYRASLARLEEIYRGISESAVSVSSWRCPYKDIRDRCTAAFGCRNQSYVDGPDRPALCTGSDDLDYRSAWEKA
jgi:hypothetical protein